MMRVPVSKYVITGLLGLGAAGSLVMGLSVPSTPANAQLTVFDPNNYSQNILTAARTLQQINNQIKSLQNEAQGLINQAKNLTKIDFPQLAKIKETLQAIDKLMREAQGIQFKVATLDKQYLALFPEDFGKALKLSQRVAAARERLETSIDGFRHAMTVQAGVIENVQTDAEALAEIVASSQGAEGSLQAQQATNQLLALTTKQQFQLQHMMAAQFRAQSIEEARRVQAEEEARTATKKFLGTGTAYTPK